MSRACDLADRSLTRLGDLELLGLRVAASLGVDLCVAVVVVVAAFLWLINLVLEEQLVVALLDVGRDGLGVADICASHIVLVSQAS